jgi:hypothetical protein
VSSFVSIADDHLVLLVLVLVLVLPRLFCALVVLVLGLLLFVRALVLRVLLLLGLGAAEAVFFERVHAVAPVRSGTSQRSAFAASVVSKLLLLLFVVVC